MAALYANAGLSGSKPISLRDRLTRRWGAMKAERASFDSHVREVFDQTRPRRTRFTQTNANNERRNNAIIDNTGVIAARVLTSGLVNGMSSPAQQWFKYEPEDLDLLEYDPVKLWIGQLERLVRRIFHASNVYQALPELYDELILAGTAAGVIEDDFDDVIRLSTFTWGEYALAVNSRRMVDTLYRETRMTVEQVVGAFVARGDGSLDWSKASSTVKTLYDTSNYDAPVNVMHAIEPNLERDPSKDDARNMAFRSVYWEPACSAPDQDRFLRRSGYRHNPIIAPRWDVIGHDVYGCTCPGMEALGDMRQLQIQQKRKGEAIDKQVRPPTQGPSSTADRFISQLPGYHNIVPNGGAGEGIRPIFEVKPDLQWMAADINDTQARVEEAFYVPYILSISRMEGVQPKNQMEISERKGEGLLVLGPVVQRLQNELHNPLHMRVINRVIDVCVPLWQMGEPAMLPPPPPELQGVPLAVVYTSALAQLQKQSSVTNIERLIGLVTNPNVAQAMPGMLRKIDAEQVVDELGDMFGIPAKIILGDDAVAAIAEQEAQQQQMAQVAAMAAPAKDAAMAAKALSEAKVNSAPDEGTGALEALLTQAQDSQPPAAGLSGG